MTERGSSVGLLERPKQTDSPRRREFTKNCEFAPYSELTISPELVDLISGPGNHEVKALLAALAAANPDNLLPSEHSESFSIKLNGKRNKSTKPAMLRKIFINSLIPAQLAERVQIPDTEDDEDGFRLKEEKRELMLAFAGQMLYFSLKHKPTLRALFGRTHGFLNGSNAENTITPPHTRLEIFATLLDGDLPLRAIDITKKVSKKINPHLHLSELSQNDIITYVSEKQSKGDSVVKFRLTDTGFDRKKHHNDGDLFQLVYKIACASAKQDSSKWLTENETAQLVISLEPNYSHVESQILLKSIGQIFSNLTKRGFAEKDGDSNKRSDVNLSITQRATLVDLMDLFYQFQTDRQRFIKEGIRRAHEILDDPHKVRKLFEKAYRKKHTDADPITPEEKKPDGLQLENTQSSRGPVINKNLDPDDIDWKQDGACVGAETEVFFPFDKEFEQIEVAKEICSTCPVREHCLDFALRSNELGIWGGTTEDERRRIKRQRQEAKKSA